MSGLTFVDLMFAALVALVVGTFVGFCLAIAYVKRGGLKPGETVADTITGEEYVLVRQFYDGDWKVREMNPKCVYPYKIISEVELRKIEQPE